MANKKRTKTRQRAISQNISKNSVLLSDIHKRLFRPNVSNQLTDGRYWRPLHAQKTRGINGRRITLTHRINRNTHKNSSRRNWLSFSSPKKTTVCQRRSIRRNILFATKNAGSGVKNSKVRLRTPDSNISCRRK